MIKVSIFVSKEWNEICYSIFDIRCDEKVEICTELIYWAYIRKNKKSYLLLQKPRANKFADYPRRHMGKPEFDFCN